MGVVVEPVLNDASWVAGLALRAPASQKHFAILNHPASSVCQEWEESAGSATMVSVDTIYAIG